MTSTPAPRGLLKVIVASVEETVAARGGGADWLEKSTSPWPWGA